MNVAVMAHVDDTERDGKQQHADQKLILTHEAPQAGESILFIALYAKRVRVLFLLFRSSENEKLSSLLKFA